MSDLSDFEDLLDEVISSSSPSKPERSTSTPMFSSSSAKKGSADSKPSRSSSSKDKAGSKSEGKSSKDHKEKDKPKKSSKHKDKDKAKAKKKKDEDADELLGAFGSSFNRSASNQAFDPLKGMSLGIGSGASRTNSLPVPSFLDSTQSKSSNSEKFEKSSGSKGSMGVKREASAPEPKAFNVLDAAKLISSSGVRTYIETQSSGYNSLRKAGKSTTKGKDNDLSVLSEESENPETDSPSPPRTTPSPEPIKGTLGKSIAPHSSALSASSKASASQSQGSSFGGGKFGNLVFASNLNLQDPSELLIEEDEVFSEPEERKSRPGTMQPAKPKPTSVSHVQKDDSDFSDDEIIMSSDDDKPPQRSERNKGGGGLSKFGNLQISSSLDPEPTKAKSKSLSSKPNRTVQLEEEDEFLSDEIEISDDSVASIEAEVRKPAISSAPKPVASESSGLSKFGRNLQFASDLGLSPSPEPGPHTTPASQINSKFGNLQFGSALEIEDPKPSQSGEMRKFGNLQMALDLESPPISPPSSAEPSPSPESKIGKLKMASDIAFGSIGSDSGPSPVPEESSSGGFGSGKFGNLQFASELAIKTPSPEPMEKAKASPLKASQSGFQFGNWQFASDLAPSPSPSPELEVSSEKTSDQSATAEPTIAASSALSAFGNIQLASALDLGSETIPSPRNDPSTSVPAAELASKALSGFGNIQFGSALDVEAESSSPEGTKGSKTWEVKPSGVEKRDDSPDTASVEEEMLDDQGQPEGSEAYDDEEFEEDSAYDQTQQPKPSSRTLSPETHQPMPAHQEPARRGADPATVEALNKAASLGKKLEINTEELKYWKIEAMRLAQEKDKITKDLTHLLRASAPQPQKPRGGAEDLPLDPRTLDPPPSAPVAPQLLDSRSKAQIAYAEPLQQASQQFFASQLYLLKAQISRNKMKAERVRAPGGGHRYSTLEDTIAEIHTSAARPKVRSYAEALEEVRMREKFGWG